MPTPLSPVIVLAPSLTRFANSLANPVPYPLKEGDKVRAWKVEWLLHPSPDSAPSSINDWFGLRVCDPYGNCIEYDERDETIRSVAQRDLVRRAMRAIVHDYPAQILSGR